LICHFQQHPQKATMRLLFAFATLLTLHSAVFAQDKYQYSANLINIEDDKVNVELITPTIKEGEIVFSFPRIIPGSYSEKNFGKYIDDFTAIDSKGKKLKIKKLNPNQYQIRNATQLSQIRYKVNDTWDTSDKDFIFQPGGTNIEAGNNVVMNNHAFYGYFEGYKNLPFELKVDKPAYMYASTHLQVDRTNNIQDIIKADNYFSFADNPIFYSTPDTSSFKVGESIINVAVISATGKVKSKQVANYLQPVAQALNIFFEGLPVSSYQFLFYFEDMEKLGKKSNGGFGALEHNYSSLYFLPEMSYEPRLKSIVLEVASHEFLHILTPLNLHSEEIEDFDFITPKMSKHLWLYEGVTEYFAQLTQVQNGLLTEKAFFNNLRDKINEADKFGNFSLTTMSERVLESPYKDKYNSVYNKGALTAMLLDIFIREKTHGAKDLKTVIMTLTKKYGPGKPFKDEQLFSELVATSHPAVQEFIDDYIVGEKPLPYQQLFDLAGYDFREVKKVDAFFNGKLGLKYDEVSKGFAFANVDKKNALDIENNDIWLSVNGTSVTEDNMEKLWEQYFYRNNEYPEISITVKRNGMEKTLSGKLFKGFMEVKNNLEPVPQPNDDQKKMLQGLLGNI
jgi:predicted metalloprotease with PDZ domain